MVLDWQLGVSASLSRSPPCWTIESTSYSSALFGRSDCVTRTSLPNRKTTNRITMNTNLAMGSYWNRPEAGWPPRSAASSTVCWYRLAPLPRPPEGRTLRRLVTVEAGDWSGNRSTSVAICSRRDVIGRRSSETLCRHIIIRAIYRQLGFF